MSSPTGTVTRTYFDKQERRRLGWLLWALIPLLVLATAALFGAMSRGRVALAVEDRVNQREGPERRQLGRRRFAGACLDWTERRPHLNGVLGAAITARTPSGLQTSAYRPQISGRCARDLR